MSTPITADERYPNLLIIALFLIVFLFTAFHEGYLPFLTLPFLLSLAAGFAMAFWLALLISTKRLLALMLVIAFLEFVKESIGIRSGMWEYHGTNRFYLFGVWCWVLAGLAVFTLATWVAVPWLRTFKLSLSPTWNLAAPPVLFLFIYLSLGEYHSGAGGLFWSLYTTLLIFDLFMVRNMETPVLLGLVLTAWVGSNLSEYVGAIASGAWTFPHNPTYPPVFLLFGCWPLEILAQYALSAWLAGETLGKYTVRQKEGPL